MHLMIILILENDLFDSVTFKFAAYEDIIPEPERATSSKTDYTRETQSRLLLEIGYEDD